MSYLNINNIKMINNLKQNSYNFLIIVSLKSIKQII